MWGSPALLVPAWLLLEVERRWTRSSRRRGGSPPLAAYLLDALAILAALAAVLGTTLFVVGVAILAARRMVELLTQAADTLRGDPLLLTGMVLTAVAASAGIALARGWVRLPRPGSRAAVPQPAHAAGLAAAPPAPGAENPPAVERPASAATPLPARAPSATRVVGAPPVAGAAPPVAGGGSWRARQARPSPIALRSRTAPWARPVAQAVTSSVPGAPRTAQAGRWTSPGTGVAHLPAADQDDEGAPALAMLNSRRPIYEQRHEQPAFTPAPAFVLAAGEPQTPPAPPAARGWWRLPAAVTLAMVVLVVVVLALTIEPLAASLAGLRVEPPESSAAPGLAAAPAALVPDGASAEDAPTSAPAPTPTLAPTPTSAPQGAARVSADRLNVRASPGANQPVVATLARGDEVLLLGEERPIRSSVWVKVRAGAVEGWVNRTYLE
jgi:hypothetical protein